MIFAVLKNSVFLVHVLIVSGGVFQIQISHRTIYFFNPLVKLLLQPLRIEYAFNGIMHPTPKFQIGQSAKVAKKNYIQRTV